MEQVVNLQIKEIGALKLLAAKLSYLSACSTAQSTSSELAEKVTHIVSSSNIPRLVNMIGTLWPLHDMACSKLAVDFYFEMSKKDNVAVSFFTAIMGLMKEKPTQLMYWALFIHFVI